jgi:hypothetical protein
VLVVTKSYILPDGPSTSSVAFLQALVLVLMISSFSGALENLEREGKEEYLERGGEGGGERGGRENPRERLRVEGGEEKDEGVRKSRIIDNMERLRIIPGEIETGYISLPTRKTYPVVLIKRERYISPAILILT